MGYFQQNNEDLPWSNTEIKSLIITNKYIMMYQKKYKLKK